MSTKDIFREFNDLIKKKVWGAGVYLVENIAIALSSARVPKRGFFSPSFFLEKYLKITK